MVQELVAFISNLTGLQPATTYYFVLMLPIVQVQLMAMQFLYNQLLLSFLHLQLRYHSITLTTAVSGGNITSDGGATVTERVSAGQLQQIRQ